MKIWILFWYSSNFFFNNEYIVIINSLLYFLIRTNFQWKNFDVHMYVNISLISLLIICMSVGNSLYQNYGNIWKFKNMLMKIFNNKVIIVRYKNYFSFFAESI